jgi:Flp pilus assembly protein TadD
MADQHLSTLNNEMDPLRRAWIAFGAGRWNEAEFSCRLALGTNKKNADALHLMGLIEFQSGRLDNAEKYIRDALKLSPRSAQALCNLG